MGFLEFFIGLFALQFGATSRRENLERDQVFLSRLHCLGMEDREMSNRTTLRRPHRHTDITLSSDLLQPQIFWIFLAQP